MPAYVSSVTHFVYKEQLSVCVRVLISYNVDINGDIKLWLDIVSVATDNASIGHVHTEMPQYYAPEVT